MQLRLMGLRVGVVVLLALGSMNGLHAEADEAVELFARGDYGAVVKLLRPRWSKGSAQIQECILLARAYLHLGQVEGSLPVLQSVLVIDAENPDANSLTGWALHEQGRHRGAIPFLEQALRLKDDPVTASLLGRCHFLLGEFSRAKVYLQQALEKDIRDPINSLTLGKIHLERGAGARAQRYLLAAREAGLESAELHELLGRAYVLQEKYVGPVMVQQVAGRPEPGHIVGGRFVLAPVEGSPGEYMVCTQYCALYEGHLLLEKRPDSTEAMFMLASGWLAAGDAVRAEKFIQKQSQREGDSKRITSLRARMLLVSQDLDGLDSVLARASEKGVLGPDSLAEFYYQAALQLRARGEHGGAIAFLEKADEKRPMSVKVLRSLAELSQLAGRGKDARQYYARVVDLFPDAPDIDELRNRLRVLQEEEGGG